jgi:hypothetical protein
MAALVELAAILADTVPGARAVIEPVSGIGAG